jgi:D-alanyl-D-alanine carboxypeptidase/D-alanyl-D-alanine-endopeptidase (penicillin-binding protein 4)
MKGGVMISGLLMGGIGLLAGWCLWGGPEVIEIRQVRERGEPAVEERTALGEIFRKWSQAEELEGAAVGFCVLDGDGEVVYASPLAETALCPASALKTLTAGAAFGLLGEGFRFVTDLVAVGGLSGDGVVPGDLVIRGGGDPTLSEADLEKLAEDAVRKGLKRVKGTLRVDEAIFPNDPVSDHWVWGDLGNAYGAGAFGLNVGRNMVRLVFAAGEKEGDAAGWLRSEPDIFEGIDWEIEVRTGPAGSGDGVMVYSSPRQRWIRAVGTVPLGAKGFPVRAALPDPPQFAGEFLRKALVSRGVIFCGEITEEDLTEVGIASHGSAPLAEIVDHMQRVSDNLEAQCLFLMMGAKAGKDPAVVLSEYWEGMGVSFEGLRLIDGSGLARAAMIRPVDLARVNHVARRAGYGEKFLASLPGDVGLKSKRGAMSGVRTEVGFVERGGKGYTFALMANGLGNVDFWKLRESLLEGIGR